jgi:pyruvate dehydrogenase E2 component (dihydrolipoamide acetyltransferase)
VIEFRLPSLGAEMDEGTLIEWKVKVGDPVRKGDVVAVVDTSKSAIDVEIWEEGIVAELLLEPGATVPVGTVIARLRAPGEAGEAAARPRISPAARKRAAELGVDLAAVAGSGPEGTVGIADVERMAAKPAGAATLPPAPATALRVSPAPAPATSTAPAAAPPKDRATAMRHAIAAAMARSKREIPHYYLATDIPLAQARSWLAERNASRPVTERVLLAALLLKAVALALVRHRELNGFFRDGAFVPGPGIHVGVAIAIRGGGLIAPAIHDTDAKPLDLLMRELADLVARARALTLKSSEMADPTVTVTNLGEQGARLVEGIIYPPQVALVGFGGVADRPWVEDGKLTVCPVVTASLAADHRVTDGHLGALFLDELARLLQAPERL